MIDSYNHIKAYIAGYGRRSQSCCIKQQICDIFLDTCKNYSLTFHVNHLPANNSHEISGFIGLLRCLHRIKKYLNMVEFLEKSLKNKSALNSSGKIRPLKLLKLIYHLTEI